MNHKTCLKCFAVLNRNNTTGFCYRCYNKSITKSVLRHQLDEARAVLEKVRRKIAEAQAERGRR